MGPIRGREAGREQPDRVCITSGEANTGFRAFATWGGTGLASSWQGAAGTSATDVGRDAMGTSSQDPSCAQLPSPQSGRRYTAIRTGRRGLRCRVLQVHTGVSIWDLPGALAGVVQGMEGPGL